MTTGNQILSIILSILLGGTVAVTAQPSPETVKYTLNGLDITLDTRTGSILTMYYPATGNIISTSPDSAGILDMALPVKEFEPLRVASRFSKNTRISRKGGTVMIHWDALGSSRDTALFKGKVSATVTLREQPDGQSVSMSCEVTNHSSQSIPQVIFPDFFGIVPFAGKQQTELRTATTSIRPFVEMWPSEHDDLYALYGNTRWLHFGNVFDRENLVIKWTDIGGLGGGLSMFTKTWGHNGGNNEGVYLHFYEVSQKLRYMNVHYTEIPPRGTWKSDEFIITPHQYGWAKGIEPYRKWAQQNIKRLYPLPQHVEDGLGFRSLWMKNSFYPGDPQGINFTFADLLKAAADAKENGLDEMVLWVWYRGQELPIPAPFTQLGTEQDMARAIAECRKIGVNTSLFINFMRVRNDQAYKYGVHPNNESYMYDPEFIPMFRPRYSTYDKGPTIPQSNPQWQADFITSVKRYVSEGIYSFCWDQFHSNIDGPENYLDTVMRKIRKITKDKYPQSTMSGEAGTNIEFEADFLDYTWNWNLDSSDYRALVSVFKAPRINTNIDKSVAEVKYGFADNLYLNIQPRKPDGINGSAYISDYPELGKALKQCARLRRQFLNYFVNGTFIADCVLSQYSPNAHVSAYTLPKSMLVIVINKNSKRRIAFEGNIRPWLPSKTGKYRVRVYNDGRLIKIGKLNSPQWKERTPEMNKLDIVLYELIPE